jgi:hypothetical protein
MGPDCIHPKILKRLSSAIAPILRLVFQKSLDSGEVPADWKQAHVSPIFKKGVRYDPANYRPVSLTCVCSKVLEHIVTKHLVSHLDQNKILYDMQHGFRSKRSTETQLMAFTQDVLKNLRSGQQTDVIIMDFAKAFDKVSHWRLAMKLRNYGITGTVNKWIEDFLTDRTQRVVCTGESSEWAAVQSGVPQGSVIGPILFLIYINDLPENINSSVRLFADDTIMYMTMTNESDASALQADLDKLAAWEEKWQMKFHPDKCSVLCVTRSRTPNIHDYKLHQHTLKAEDKTKYLGVTIDSKLCWNSHIDNVTKKSKFIIGLPSSKSPNFPKAHKGKCIYHISQTTTGIRSISVGPVHQGETKAIGDGATPGSALCLQQLQLRIQCDSDVEPVGMAEPLASEIYIAIANKQYCGHCKW